MAVAEISDQDGAAQLTEITRRKCHAPGRVELAMLSESLAQLTIGLEHVHDAMAFACYIVVLCIVLHRKGHKKFAAGGNNVKRGIVMRQLWIGERGHRRKGGVVDVHLAAPEIGGIQEGRAFFVRGDGEPFINGAAAALRVGHAGVVNSDDPMHARGSGLKALRVDVGVPADNRPVLSCKEENGRSCRRDTGAVDAGNLECLLGLRGIEDEAGRRPARAQGVARRRDADDPRLRCALRIVERRFPGVVVRNPEGRGRRFADTPWVQQIWIEKFSNMHNAILVGQRWHVVDRFVDYEIRFDVTALLARIDDSGCPEAGNDEYSGERGPRQCRTAHGSLPR